MDFKVWMQTTPIITEQREGSCAKRACSFGAKARKKMTTFYKNYFKVENDPQALGRILVDFELFGQTGSFFLYPRVPPCRANFLNIRPRIKFLYTKWIEIENNGEKHIKINSSPSR